MLGLCAWPPCCSINTAGRCRAASSRLSAHCRRATSAAQRTLQSLLAWSRFGQQLIHSLADGVGRQDQRWQEQPAQRVARLPAALVDRAAGTTRDVLTASRPSLAGPWNWPIRPDPTPRPARWRPRALPAPAAGRGGRPRAGGRRRFQRLVARRRAVGPRRPQAPISCTTSATWGPRCPPIGPRVSSPVPSRGQACRICSSRGPSTGAAPHRPRGRPVPRTPSTSIRAGLAGTYASDADRARRLRCELIGQSPDRRFSRDRVPFRRPFRLL